MRFLVWCHSTHATQVFLSSYVLGIAIANLVFGLATFALGVVFKPYESPLPNRYRATLDAANAWMYLCGICAAVRRHGAARERIRLEFVHVL